MITVGEQQRNCRNPAGDNCCETAEEFSNTKDKDSPNSTENDSRSPLRADRPEETSSPDKGQQEESDLSFSPENGQGDVPELSREQLTQFEEEIASLKDRLQTKEGQVEELLSRLQRLQSDFDNFRKRTQREKEELEQTAAASLVQTLLPVVDNFERAAQAAPGDEPAFREGIGMILKQLEKVLADAGLESISSVGSPFDPNFHQAVFVVEDDSCEENTVVEELQKGYLFAGRVLRPAMVKVSRRSN